MLPTAVRRKRSHSESKRDAFIGNVPALAIFAFAKSVRVIGVVAAVELLTHLPVMVFCFLTLFVASIEVAILQKPWYGIQKISKQVWLRVFINSVFIGVVWLLWSKGLQLCGALRTVIVEHSQVCIAGLLAIVVKGPGKSGSYLNRGEIVFLCAFFILFYHGATTSIIAPALKSQNHSSPFIEEIGLVSGLIILVVSSLLGAVREKFAAKVAKDVGGAKRLHSLSLLFCTLFASPLLFLDFIGEAVIGADYDYSVFSSDTAAKTILAATFVIVLQFYTSSVGSTHLSAGPSNVVGIISSFVCALVLVHFEVATDGSPMDHESFYYPVVIACCLSALGVWEVSSHANSSGDIEGFDRDEDYVSISSNMDSERRNIPISSLWSSLSRLILADDMPDIIYKDISSSSNSNGEIDFGNSLKKMYRHVLNTPDSRKIAKFICLNLVFTLVELFVGIYSNSLGLISDSGHMFFDCTALFIGLFASYISKLKPDKYYTYGYGRWETLCGFVNGVFLVFIAVFIMTESLERLSEPPELIAQSSMLLTSILGFFVNLVGLIFFHDHAHLGSGSECDHGHSHGNDNMHGVFLHILADALGSLGVIVSSLLVKYKGWYIADPLCSLMISILIIVASIPLLRATSSSLLLVNTPYIAESFNQALREILKLPGVLGIREPQLWMQTSAISVASLHVVIDDGSNEQDTSQSVDAILKRRIPTLKHSYYQIYCRSMFQYFLENQPKFTPLFWDYASGELFYSKDGLLSDEQKLQQQQNQGHEIPSTFNNFENHENHGHSHGGVQCHGHLHSSENHLSDQNINIPDFSKPLGNLPSFQTSIPKVLRKNPVLKSHHGHSHDASGKCKTFNADNVL